MYSILTIIEKIFQRINQMMKILYYKIKYGKRFKCGKRVKFRKRFQLNISDNGYVSIGNDCFFNNDCSINAHKKIIIGDNNIFGENVKIYDHNHIFNDKKIDFKKNFNERSITIANNNWFGSNCVILSKAKIGSYNVFSANLSINEEYESENIVTLENKKTVKKIIYK